MTRPYPAKARPKRRMAKSSTHLHKGIDEPTMLRWKRAGSTKERSAHMVLPTNEMKDPKAGMRDATTVRIATTRMRLECKPIHSAPPTLRQSF